MLPARCGWKSHKRTGFECQHWLIRALQTEAAPELLTSSSIHPNSICVIWIPKSTLLLHKVLLEPRHSMELGFEATQISKNRNSSEICCSMRSRARCVKPHLLFEDTSGLSQILKKYKFFSVFPDQDKLIFWFPSQHQNFFWRYKFLKFLTSWKSRVKRGKARASSHSKWKSGFTRKYEISRFSKLLRFACGGCFPEHWHQKHHEKEIF